MVRAACAHARTHVAARVPSLAALAVAHADSCGVAHHLVPRRLAACRRLWLYPAGTNADGVLSLFLQSSGVEIYLPRLLFPAATFTLTLINQTGSGADVTRGERTARMRLDTALHRVCPAFSPTSSSCRRACVLLADSLWHRKIATRDTVLDAGAGILFDDRLELKVDVAVQVRDA